MHILDDVMFNVYKMKIVKQRKFARQMAPQLLFTIVLLLFFPSVQMQIPGIYRLDNNCAICMYH